MEGAAHPQGRALTWEPGMTPQAADALGLGRREALPASHHLLGLKSRRGGMALEETSSSPPSRVPVCPVLCLIQDLDVTSWRPSWLPHLDHPPLHQSYPSSRARMRTGNSSSYVCQCPRSLSRPLEWKPHGDRATVCESMCPPLKGMVCPTPPTSAHWVSHFRPLCCFPCAELPNPKPSAFSIFSFPNSESQSRVSLNQ